MEKKKMKNKLSKGQREFLHLMKIATNVTIEEDLRLLKKLAKH